MLKQIGMGAAMVACLCVSLAFGEESAPWKSSYFDGSQFRDGTAAKGPIVYRRDGYLPVVRDGEKPDGGDRLPAGAGGAVIFCYVQSTGGKLANRSGASGVAGLAVTIDGDGRRIALPTDGNGFAVIALPAGEYTVTARGFRKTVRIEKGKTITAAIRAGKRMVD